LAEYNSDLAVLQEVRWVEGGSHPMDDYTFFLGNGNANQHLGTCFFIHKGIISAFLNVHAPTEDESDNTKDSFHEEIEQIFDQVLKCHMKILFGDFSANEGEKTFSKQQQRMRVYMILVMIIWFE
jgi:hypothetical protein